MKAAEEPRVKAVATWAAVNDYDSRWDALQMEQWKNDGVQYVLNGRTGQQMPLYYQIVEDYYQNKHRLDIPEVIKRCSNPFCCCMGSRTKHCRHKWLMT
ncbi:hypothetical protein GCM10028895_17280 [Pontibacter rugosus]